MQIMRQGFVGNSQNSLTKC